MPRYLSLRRTSEPNPAVLNDMALQTYSVFGLIVRSEMPLKELSVAAEQYAWDVDVRRGAIEECVEDHPGYNTRQAGTLLYIPKVGRYLVRNGREVIVDAHPDASERNVRLFLLGSAFGALLHQRGLLPLHANAMEIDSRLVAFSGHSGAGKSTIAAWFHDRGHRILADDVCVIRFDDEGRPLAYPGIPRLRLWREALEAGGRAADDYHRSFDDMDKYDVPTRPHSQVDPVPLARIYLLRKASDGADGSIRRLTGVEAVDALVSNTYRGAYLKTINRTGEHLATCLRLARAVPIFEAARVWGFDQFDREAELLQKHVSEAS